MCIWNKFWFFSIFFFFLGLNTLAKKFIIGWVKTVTVMGFLVSFKIWKSPFSSTIKSDLCYKAFGFVDTLTRVEKFLFFMFGYKFHLESVLKFKSHLMMIFFPFHRLKWKITLVSSVKPLKHCGCNIIFFSMLLDSVCQYFIYNFCHNFCELRLMVIFLYKVLVSEFWYLYKVIWGPFLLFFRRFCEIGTIPSLNSW